MIALVDCNSFYCSCEAVFRPDLWKKPTVVLSNNDGCVIARNQGAKDCHIPMGAPVHHYKDVIKKHGIEVFSANFPLYADFSSRIMSLLNRFSPLVEVYSIDEAFLDLPDGLSEEALVTCGRAIRTTILQYTGIPVSIGIAPTKVLAKCANRYAKKIRALKGVYALVDKEDRGVMLRQVDVKDVWGIGSRLAQKCYRLGVRSAYDFMMYDNKARIQAVFTKIGRQLQDELRGLSCLEVSDIVTPRKQIRTSRSFSPELKDLEDIQSALSVYVHTAMEKCRRQGSKCQTVTVFMGTNRFRKTKQYSNACTVGFSDPTQDTIKVTQAVRMAAKHMYKDGYSYKKAGVILSNLSDGAIQQMGLFGQSKENPELMKAMDQLNLRFGSKSIHLADQARYWQKKHRAKHVSPSYTTSWDELLTVN